MALKIIVLAKQVPDTRNDVLNIYEFADKDHHLISAQQIEDSVLYDTVLSVLPAIVPDLKAFYQENMHELENLPKKALAGQQQI